MRWCWRETGNRELAADLSAEVFAAALTAARRYRRKRSQARTGSDDRPRSGFLRNVGSSVARPTRRSRSSITERREVRTRRYGLADHTLSFDPRSTCHGREELARLAVLGHHGATARRLGTRSATGCATIRRTSHSLRAATLGSVSARIRRVTARSPASRARHCRVRRLPPDRTCCDHPNAAD